MVTVRERARRAGRIATMIAVLGVGLGLATLGHEPDGAADTAPAPTFPTTVGAKPLPTVQVNGIVWAQASAGDIVYAVGNFTTSRPPGAAPNTQTSPAGNVIAYNIRTGERVPLALSLNGAGRSVALSPDASKLYVGGDFTKANGFDAFHIVRFDLASGSIDFSWRPTLGGTPLTIVPTASTVYVGGGFTSAGFITGGSSPRTNTAAFTTAGSLLPWAPPANGVVRTMLLTPDGSKVVIGGSFTTLNGAAVYGLAAVDPTSGANVAWAATGQIKVNSAEAGIVSLTTDGTLIYGGEFVWVSAAQGNLEGRFALNPSDGSIVWVTDCFGDTNAVLPVGGVVYSVGHTHTCAAAGSFGEGSAPEGYKYSMAESKDVHGVNVADGRGWPWTGTPAAAILDWFPFLTPASTSLGGMPAGTVAVSGTAMSGWSLAASADGAYLAVGGEFTQAAFSPQQGLTRFAVPSVAGSTAAPIYESVVAPTVTQTSLGGSALVTWTSAWDRDSEVLRYEVFRAGRAAPLTTQYMRSLPWDKVAVGGFEDRGLAPGTYTYTLTVSDAEGNAVSRASTVTINQDTAGTPGYVNLARGRTPTSSSVYSNLVPANAVDENLSTTFATTSTAAAWWQVDLGASSPIESVYLAGRTDAPVQSSDAWVFVSSNPFNTALTPAEQAATPGVVATYRATINGTVKVQLPPGATGRYVMVQHGGTNNLGFREIRVMGFPAGDVDLALHRGASMSSLYGAGYDASRALDDENATFSIANNVGLPWWQTDLGSVRPVNAISVAPRPDCCASQLANVWVFASASPLEARIAPATLAQQPGVWSTFLSGNVAASTVNLPAGTQARYVMIRRSTTDYLSIARVNVWGPAGSTDTAAPTPPSATTATATGMSVKVAWKPSYDLPVPGASGLASYRVLRDGVVAGTVAPLDPTEFTDPLVGAGSHAYTVVAVDANGQVSSASGAASVQVVNTDTQAPQAPPGVAVSLNGSNQPVVTWGAATDLPNPGGVGVAAYWVVRDWTTQWLVSSAGPLSYTDTGAAAGSHRYQVFAVDRNGLLGAGSAAATVTVPGAADTQAPQPPPGVAVSLNGSNQPVVTWGAATDLPNPGGVGVGAYWVVRDWTTQWLVSSAGPLSYTDTGAAAGSHRYQVFAVDRNNQIGAGSTAVTIVKP